MSIDFTAATFVALIPFALGGVFSIFKPFIEGQDKFKNRCKKSLANTSEQIAVAIQTLIKEAQRSKDFAEGPRGDGVSTRDFYGEIASAIDKHSKLSIRTQSRMKSFCFCETIMFYGIIVAIICAIISLFITNIVSWLIVICIFVIVIQVAAIIVIRNLIKWSEGVAEIL